MFIAGGKSPRIAYFHVQFSTRAYALRTPLAYGRCKWKIFPAQNIEEPNSTTPNKKQFYHEGPARSKKKLKRKEPSAAKPQPKQQVLLRRSVFAEIGVFLDQKLFTLCLPRL
jgi:hypothetical protein